MNHANRRQAAPEEPLFSSRIPLPLYLLRSLINITWIFIGFRLLFSSWGTIPVPTSFLAVIIPSVYCFWRNWIKFNSGAEFYENFVIFAPEDAPFLEVRYQDLISLIQRKKQIEVVTRRGTVIVPLWSHRKKAVSFLQEKVRTQTGRTLPVREE